MVRGTLTDEPLAMAEPPALTDRGLDNLAVVVVTAGLADVVGSLQLAAIRAFGIRR
jgi:hypothetical protein